MSQEPCPPSDAVIVLRLTTKHLLWVDTGVSPLLGFPAVLPNGGKVITRKDHVCLLQPAGAAETGMTFTEPPLGPARADSVLCVCYFILSDMLNPQLKLELRELFGKRCCKLKDQSSKKLGASTENCSFGIRPGRPEALPM